ncbi:hypothetical protein FHX82_007277 [Amycolatopsis bartoniae]|uniref:Uncharacterized protein n=1 Tax=Amycolatopsis bartoniae TaxID=941986 RepID=A0A8H9MEY7_9PSEU|nr:hypothetical protein [Amycolatopsis bartoniae]MBB2940191.1 hypothetical protein [Amycolatopsis bartoniae]TVT11284.1 hypothetical protein FNH07_02485 [Amycolatopsis bartoniae]GHF66286.1 hypothetical protein GCM10017566_45080 [Amycolatopsis bartoniae]
MIVHVGSTLAIAESSTRRWRLYRMTPLSTPLSIVASDEGLPPIRTSYPLAPEPAEVQAMAQHLDVDLRMLTAALHAHGR